MKTFSFGFLPMFQAPDAAPGAADPPAVDPAVVAEPAAVDPPAEPAAEAAPLEPPAEAEPEPKPHGNKGRTPWYLDRISEESRRAREAEERARTAEEMLSRMQKPGTTTEPGSDVIETRAQQIASERLAVEKLRAVVSAGTAKFDDWEERAQMLGAVGAAAPEFVLDVVAVDPANAHEILHALASDPQKAARLTKMDARARTVEIVKMSMAVTGGAAPEPKPEPRPAPKTVSKAPAPPPSIDPGTSPANDWRSDKVSDNDFSKGWDEEQRKRAQRGRR